MARNYWLVKQEPTDYSWSQFNKDQRTAWTGVRNYAARLHLRAMQAGDWVAFYHSGGERNVVGLARVAATAYPDPTADEGGWVAVDLEVIKPLHQPVTLAAMKADAILQGLEMLRQTRLSVSPVTRPQFEQLLKLAQTKA